MEPPQSVVLSPSLSVICIKVRCAPVCTLKWFPAPLDARVTLLPPLMVRFDAIEWALLRVIVIGSGPQSNKISFAAARALLKADSVQAAACPCPIVTRPSVRVRKAWSAP